jgi:signal transduction histidine kinase
VSAEAETCLHQVAREALVNIIRHARARHVDVSLRARDGYLELVVADDGVGHVEHEAHGTGWGGFGLRMMRERAEEIGGTFELQSTAGIGTRITVRVPRAASGGQTGKPDASPADG